MNKLFSALVVSSMAVVVLSNATSAIAQETEACDPYGRLISGLELEGDSELLCAGATLPVPEDDTTITAVCFTSNTIEEVELEAGESMAVSELCPPVHSVVDCGDGGICFSPRGEVAPIAISINGTPRVTVLDWNDIPGSNQYVIEVFDGAETVFVAQPAVSQVETRLALDGDETVSVTALSPTRLIIGYGSLSTADEDKGRPVSWVVE